MATVNSNQSCVFIGDNPVYWRYGDIDTDIATICPNREVERTVDMVVVSHRGRPYELEAVPFSELPGEGWVI